MEWCVVWSDIAIVSDPQLSHKNLLKPQCTFKWINLGPNPVTTMSQPQGQEPALFGFCE